MNKDDVIEKLNLQPHPLEGGFFGRTYESELHVDVEAGSRLLASSIYYVLTDDSPIGHMHRNKSDIVHYFHAGNSIKYTIISPEGEVSNVVLGCHLDRGEMPQLIVKSGYWKIAEMQRGKDDYSLLSEVVIPGFEYADNEIATQELVRELFPNLLERLKKYIAE